MILCGLSINKKIKHYEQLYELRLEINYWSETFLLVA